MGWFAPQCEIKYITAVPAAGADVQMLILGSSLFGAQLAGQLGLPFAFASHFAPTQLYEAAACLSQPFPRLGPAARPLRHRRGERDLRRDGARGQASVHHDAAGLSGSDPGHRRLQAPPGPLDWTPREERQVAAMLACSAVGSPAQVRATLQGIAHETCMDELILVTDTHDFAARQRSLTLTAEAWH